MLLAVRALYVGKDKKYTMQPISIILAIIAFTLYSVAAENDTSRLVHVQVVGEVVAPKKLEITADMTIKEFFKEVDATPFASTHRLIVIRIRHEYNHSDSGIVEGSNTGIRDLRVSPDDLIKNLGLKGGEIICVVEKPPVKK